MIKFKKEDYGFITDLRVSYKKNIDKQYSIWIAMINRCYNTNSKAYVNYGAKGVTICDEWKLYSNFKKWYDENYIEGYHLDKDIGGNKIYSPDNCTFIKQSLNTRIARQRNEEYYRTTPSRRQQFIISCVKKGWNFNDFEEIDSGERSSRHKLFYYVRKD